MNALVVTYSVFGNTQKIAEAIAQTLRSQGSVRVVGPDDLASSDLSGTDLVVMGAPTHRMNLPEAVRPVFKALAKGVLAGKAVAAFDTAYKLSPMLGWLTAAPKLSRKLRKLGGQQVAPPETFYVIGREGPLYAGEIQRARAWAGSMLEQFEAMGDD